MAYFQKPRGCPDDNPEIAERLIETFNAFHDRSRETSVRSLVTDTEAMTDKGLYLLLAEGRGFYIWTFNQLFNELNSRGVQRSLGQYLASADPRSTHMPSFILT